MPEPDFFIRSGDTASPLALTLEDAAGAAVDIQDSIVDFHMRTIDGITLQVDAAAQVDQVDDGSDGSKGKVHYDWQAADSAVSGLYLGEFEVTFGGGQVQSFPNNGYILIRVTEQVK